MNASIPIGLQLFSVRGETSRDLPGTLRAIAAMGYQGAEPWGYNGASLEHMGHPAPVIRRMYDDNGLVCCGIHLAAVALEGNLSRTVEFCQTLGCRFLIIAADKQRMASLAGIQQLAGVLNNAAGKLAPEGMACGYHAHAFDFQLVEGRVAWDVLSSLTASEVIMQMDIGNCASGGGDPIATLARFPNRTRSLHLKDHGGPEGSVIGEGTIDWDEVFRVCRQHQPVIEWYVIEEGGADGMGFDIPRRSLESVHRILQRSG